MLNQLSGQVAEMQLANALRSAKRFRLSRFFDVMPPDADATLNITDVKTRVIVQRADGKNQELDVVAESACGHVLVVEVKKRAVKTSAAQVQDFYEKAAAYQHQQPDQTIAPAFLSLGGFSADALALCRQQGIAVAAKMMAF